MAGWEHLANTHGEHKSSSCLCRRQTDEEKFTLLILSTHCGDLNIQLRPKDTLEIDHLI